LAKTPLPCSSKTAEDIFDADETGLFHRCFSLPGVAHVFNNDKCVGGMPSKERLALLVRDSVAGEISTSCYRYDSETKTLQTL